MSVIRSQPFGTDRKLHGKAETCCWYCCGPDEMGLSAPFLSTIHGRLFLAADHVAAHNFLFLQDYKIPADGWGASETLNDLNKFLENKFSVSSGLINNIFNYQVYLDKEAIEKAGTDHGVWNPYDAHIPLLFLGGSIPHESTYEQVNITDITPTICALLGIQEPNGCVGQLIKTLIRDNKR